MHRWAATALLLALALAEAPSSAATGEEAGSWLPAHAAHAAPLAGVPGENWRRSQF